MNQTQFAKHLGISQQRVAKLIQQGILKESVVEFKRGSKIGYKIDPVVGKKEYDANRSLINRPESRPAKKRRVKKKPSLAEMEGTVKEGRTGSLDFRAVQTLHEQYKAALKKLEYDEKSGKLIPADDVARDASLVGQLIKKRLIAIPGRISILVAVESDSFQCEQIIKTEINQILEEISSSVRVSK